jgi:hypothetical protein
MEKSRSASASLPPSGSLNTAMSASFLTLDQSATLMATFW